MKNFYVVANPEKDPGFERTKAIKQFLELRGARCAYEGMERVYEKSEKVGHVFEQIPADTECVVVLGGDGTLIQAAGRLARKNIPLIGINLGTMGYLAEVEKDNIFPMLERLLGDEYEVEERMMLCGKVYINNKSEDTLSALNDIAITRSGVLRVVGFKIYVNGKLLNIYEADGMIVSTPTGSTGYSLSAGGPIVEPDAKVILITPICPHTLNTRAIILSAEDDVRIEIAPGRRQEKDTAEVAFDGGRTSSLTSGDYVVIKKAQEITRIIKMSRESFLDVLSRKMSEVK